MPLGCALALCGVEQAAKVPSCRVLVVKRMLEELCSVCLCACVQLMRSVYSQLVRMPRHMVTLTVSVQSESKHVTRANIAKMRTEWELFSSQEGRPLSWRWAAGNGKLRLQLLAGLLQVLHCCAATTQCESPVPAQHSQDQRVSVLMQHTFVALQCGRRDEEPLVTANPLYPSHRVCTPAWGISLSMPA